MRSNEEQHLNLPELSDTTGLYSISGDGEQRTEWVTLAEKEVDMERAVKGTSGQQNRVMGA